MAFGLAEGCVRIFYPYSRDHIIPAGLFEIDGSLDWKLKAGKTAAHRALYFDVVYTVNSLGYRDASRDRSKQPETYRILLYEKGSEHRTGCRGGGLRWLARYTEVSRQTTVAPSPVGPRDQWRRCGPAPIRDMKIISQAKG